MADVPGASKPSSPSRRQTGSSVDEPGHIARLLVSCPDRHGIVAAVSGFLAEADANILSADQHSTDPEALADLVLAGVNEALRSAHARVEEKAQALMGQMGLGGLGLPGLTD